MFDQVMAVYDKVLWVALHAWLAWMFVREQRAR